jgi:hypothetical protein
MNREKIFSKLNSALKEKKIPDSEIKKADRKIEKYTGSLQENATFDLNIKLKKFVHARR